MSAPSKRTLLGFAIELVIYAVLIAIYFFLVLRFLGDWLRSLFLEHRDVYAAVAILLMIGQAVALELVTNILATFLRLRKN
jgi:hypothetical protein